MYKHIHTYSSALKLSCASETPVGFIIAQTAEPPLSVSDSVKAWCGAEELNISRKLLGTVAAAAPETTLWEPLAQGVEWPLKASPKGPE